MGGKSNKAKDSNASLLPPPEENLLTQDEVSLGHDVRLCCLIEKILPGDAHSKSLQDKLELLKRHCHLFIHDVCVWDPKRKRESEGTFVC